MKIKRINKKNIILSIKYFFLILFLAFINKNNISKINFILYFINIKNELRKINNYFQLCNDFELIKIKIFRKSNNPKISIISPIYNRERYIIRLIKSIQYQYFNDIEIILIDDCSKDDSIITIEKIKIIDERIILIKNKKNKGTFISRNIGVQFSKGKYIILPDPDDILSKNILKYCYKLAEKHKFEMIRFLQYTGVNHININDNNKKKISLFQPELSLYIFYGNNELQIIDFFINNKFLKKDVYIKSLDILKFSYLNLYLICYEDQIMNYIIHRISKSFFLLNKIGYYYLRNSISITKNEFKISYLKIKFIFIYLKVLFEFSKNKKYEKDIANLLLTNLNYNINIEKTLSKIDIKKSYKAFIDIINMYLRSKFITNENKYLFKNLKNIILKKK